VQYVQNTLQILSWKWQLILCRQLLDRIAGVLLVSSVLPDIVIVVKIVWSVRLSSVCNIDVLWLDYSRWKVFAVVVSL